MIEVAAIAGLITSLKAAGEITAGLISVRDAAKIQSKVVELNTVIISAQSSALAANTAQFSLLDRVRDLEEKIARLEGWEAEKKRYQLTDFGGGTFAYLLKPEMAEGEPPHRICARCYEEGHRSILQFSHEDFVSRDHYSCFRCKTEFEFGVRHEPPDELSRIEPTDF